MIFDEVFPETLSLRLTAAPYVQSQGDCWSIRNFVFTDYDLFVCSGGGAVFSIDGEEHTLLPGMALLAPPGKRIDARKIPGENFRAMAQHFTLTHIGKRDFFGMFRYRPCVRFRDRGLASALAEAYAEGSRAEGGGEGLLNHALFRTLILAFAREAWIEDRDELDPRHGFVFRMAREIEASSGSGGSLASILASAPFSADYCKRLFRRQFGASPAQYLAECRMRRAADHLMAGSTVKAASRAAGFEDELYFSRAFSKRHGMSPRAFQASQGVETRAEDRPASKPAAGRAPS